MITLLIILLLIFLAFSVPIYVSIGLASFISVLIFSDIIPMVLIQRMFSGLDAISLMALPFFVLAANIMDGGGLSKRILSFSRALVGHLAGGIALTSQVASMFFGSLSGSSPATVIAIGKIMYPELVKGGYNKSFSGGLLASAGAVSLVIPPSITLIIFAAVTGVSVSSLFMGGITAGIVLGLSSIVYIYIYAKKHNIEKDKRASWEELVKSFGKAFWSLLIPVIILGGIYTGIFSPTEAAVVSVVYAFLIGFFVYKELDLKTTFKICIDSAITSAQILVLVSSAQLFGWVLTREQVPQQVSSFMVDNVSSVIIFLLLLNVILLIMGMFMEGIAAITVTAPLIFPAAVAMGMDPVHLGVIMVTNLAIGMYTPPFGMNIFVAQTITRLELKEMMPGLCKFLAFNIAGLLLITYIPEISLFLLRFM